MRVEEVLKRFNINPVSFDERKALINLSTTEIKLLEAIGVFQDSCHSLFKY